MYGLIISAVIVILIFAAGVILLNASLKNVSGAKVEIIIDGTHQQDLEQIVITAKTVANKYFKNAAIYIQGGDDSFCDSICRAYGVMRR